MRLIWDGNYRDGQRVSPGRIALFAQSQPAEWRICPIGDASPHDHIGRSTEDDLARGCARSIMHENSTLRASTVTGGDDRGG